MVSTLSSCCELHARTLMLSSSTSVAESLSGFDFRRTESASRARLSRLVNDRPSLLVSSSEKYRCLCERGHWQHQHGVHRRASICRDEHYYYEHDAVHVFSVLAEHRRVRDSEFDEEYEEYGPSERQPAE